MDEDWASIERRIAEFYDRWAVTSEPFSKDPAFSPTGRLSIKGPELQELPRKKSADDRLCGLCGKKAKAKESPHARSRHQREAVCKGWCWECGFWSIRSQEKKQTIIDGFSYAPGHRIAGSYRGMGGRRFDIEYFDGQRCTTYDLWAGGVVPEHFRHLMPDNARFRSGGRTRVGETSCFVHSDESLDPWPHPRHLKWDRIDALREKPNTWDELARRTGMDRNTTKRMAYVMLYSGFPSPRKPPRYNPAGLAMEPDPDNPFPAIDKALGDAYTQIAAAFGLSERAVRIEIMEAFPDKRKLTGDELKPGKKDPEK